MNLKGKNNPNYKHGNCITNKKCIDCKKLIHHQAKRCKKCWYKFYRGKNNSAYIDGRTNKKYFCIDCKTRINRNSYFYGTNRCRSCMVKYLFKIKKLNTKGKNNAMYGIHRFEKKAPAYIHGMAYLPYPVEWKEMRLIIREYYRNKCQVCNKRGIHVHHINYNKHNCDRNNLILLCQKCHSKTLGNRDYWYAYFRYIMENE